MSREGETLKGHRNGIYSKCMDDDGMTQELYFGCPVYRSGKLYKKLEHLDTWQADLVAQHLANAWHDIKNMINNRSNDLRLTNIEFLSENAFKDRREGPAVIFPEFESTLSETGVRVIIRVSVTVCVPPHHSKIWVRISCIGGLKMQENEMDAFFNEADNTSLRISDLFKNVYQSNLHEYDRSINLEPKYRIVIKMSSADLGKIAELLKSNKFTMAKLFESKGQYLWISGLFNYIFGKDISDFEELKSLSEQDQWVQMVSRSNNEVAVGLCSKRHIGRYTELICLVHSPAEKLALCYDMVKESSKNAVRQIAGFV